MAYLNVDLGYFQHRKTRRLIGLLKRGAEVLPLKLWCYCGMYHPEDGRLVDLAEQEIESIVEWWGKPGEAVEAMMRVGFLSKDGDTYLVHDWLSHQGHIAKFSQRAKLAAAARWGQETSNATSIAQPESKQYPNQPNQPTKPIQPEAIASCPEPDKPARVLPPEPPPLLVFPVNARAGFPREWGLTAECLAELGETFPGLDVKAEAVKSLGWIKANPEKRKTAKGMRRFLFGWMERAPRRGPSVPANGHAPKTDFAAAIARMSAKENK